jgi:hypothetical protein
MPRQTVAAALAAIMVLTAGLIGVVAADPTTAAPNGTTETPAEPVGVMPTSPMSTSPDAGVPYWLEHLPGLLGEFENVSASDREAILAEAERMRANGAGVADVHHMVHYKLYGFGYDTPAVHRQAAAYRLEAEYGLTDAEADEFVAGYVDRRESGAEPRELRAYTIESLAAAGADVPDGADRLAARFDLTDAQERQLRATIVDQLRSDATPREGVRAVAEQLREFGVSTAELRDLVRDHRDRVDDRDRPRRGGLPAGPGPALR